MKEKLFNPGDEVFDITEPEVRAIVTKCEKDVLYIMYPDGSCGEDDIALFQRTGRYFELKNIFKGLNDDFAKPMEVDEVTKLKKSINAIEKVIHNIGNHYVSIHVADSHCWLTLDDCEEQGALRDILSRKLERLLEQLKHDK